MNTQNFRELERKVNSLISQVGSLDLALCLVANDSKEKTELRILACELLTNGIC